MNRDRETGRRGPLARLASALASLPFVPLLALVPADAASVTLGGYEVQSALGQALRMTIQISARADEEFDANCFRINPFSVAGDGLPQLTTAQMRLERRGNDQRLIITSTRAIMDPIVRLAIDVGCDTTLRREITLLLDPPPAVETLPQVAEARPTPVPIPPPGRAAGADAGRGPATPGAGAAATGARAPGADAAAAAGAPGTRAPGTTAPPGRPAAAPRAPRADSVPSLAQDTPRVPRDVQAPDSRLPPRLRSSMRLDGGGDRLTISASPLPLESAGLALSPQLSLATSLGERGRPALSENSMAMLRQRQARLRAAPAGEDLPSLEAEVVVLQKRTAEMQRQLEQVLSQMASLGVTPSLPVASPPAAGSATAPAAGAIREPLVPGPTLSTSTGGDTAGSQFKWPKWLPGNLWDDSRLIVAGSLALALFVLVLLFLMWLRRERVDQRRADRWSYVPVVAGQTGPATKVGAGATTATFPVDVPTPAEAAATAEATTAESKTDGTYKGYSRAHAAQELGVSDLAQATEKASVFVTLGRPAQAIDVLRDHIDHEPKSSAMAWLMLLDLYRQTDRYDDFNEIAQRFHLEFNAVIPEWNQPLAPLRDSGMVAFPHLIARIRDNWPRPEARSFIEDLLYDNRGGSRIGFSIPAFRDLLLMHSLLDEYLQAAQNKGQVDPATGRIVEVPEPPSPPDHLATIWKTATHERPVYATVPPESPLEMPVAATAATAAAAGAARSPVVSIVDQPSALEKSYPIIAEAVVNRWGQPGLPAYLSNLIRSSSDYGAGLTNEALAELILLHDIALDLGDSEPLLPPELIST